MSKKNRNHLYGLRSFLIYARRHWLAMILVGIVFAISSTLLVFIPVAIGSLIEALTTGADPWLFVWILVACSSIHDLTWHVAEFTYGKFILPISFNYENVLFKKTIQQPYHYFVDKFTGKLSSYVTGISQELRGFTSDLFFSYISLTINLTAVVLILGSINIQTGAVFVGGFALMLVIGRFTLSKATKMERVETDVIATKNGRIIDSIANFASIKSFHTDILEIKNIIAQQKIAFAAARRAYNWGVVFWSSMSFVIRHLIWPTTIIMNVAFYLDGSVTIGQLTTILTTALLFSNVVWEVVWYVSQFGLKFARIEESHLYLFGSQIIRDNEQKERADNVTFNNSLSIKSLSFAYPDQPDEAVLKDFNLTIRRGEKIGIVGKSGSGKSTLTKLLLGYYPELMGEIDVDGKPINIRSVSQMISFVPQDTSLFHRTISENISYGAHRTVTHEEILAAAKKAQAHEFIEKIPEGYDALVGERGVKLSGGQRQRIAIARAILKDTPILLLDEATSALDSESEKLIQEALQALMKNRTSIVIAHRLSTIAKLDRIILLDDGRIVEEGSHQELLALGGIYAKLWSHQSGGFLEE